MSKNEFSSLTRPIIGVILGTSISITSGVEELAKANKRANTTLYFFSTKGVDFENEVVTGAWFNETKDRWEKRDFPFPDVLYVRGGSGNRVREIIKSFDDMGIKRINPIVAFDKSRLYYKLRQDKNVRGYLPYTTDFEDMDQLKSILRKRKTVYMKACRGRRGTKVMRIARLSSGGYEYSYSIIGKMVKRKVSSSSSLEKEITSFFGDREVIVQQAIDLPTVGDQCRVDFRAELQRDKNGEIKIIAIPIRVGASQSPITTHGTAYRFKDYLKKLFPNRSSKSLSNLQSEIYDFLRTVYRSVEKLYGKFGEIGIDFAVDKNERIWLIECNAQSAKVSIRRCYGSGTVHQIYRNPLEYAKILAKRSR